MRGTLPTGRRAVCVWRAPDLLLARETPNGTNGRLFRLTSETPATIAATWNVGADLSDNLPRPVGGWFPGNEPPEEAAQLLEVAGLLGD